MIINNYGLHWKRDGVGWGTPGPGGKGSVTGRLSKKVKSPTVDFREQAGIYILQDGFKPIYIGQSGKGTHRLFDRLRNHSRSDLAERWDRFSWFGIYPVLNGVVDITANVQKIETDIFNVLDHLEGVLISVTEPPLNRQGGRFGEAEQYKQIPRRAPNDEEDGEDNEE